MSNEARIFESEAEARVAIAELGGDETLIVETHISGGCVVQKKVVGRERTMELRL